MRQAEMDPFYRLLPVWHQETFLIATIHVFEKS
jgi:hypothetical protein